MSLLKNIHRMNNAELIGLAKNRFLSTEVQEAIAKHPYRRAKSYLAENEGISQSAKDILWDIPGYTLKTDLIRTGKYVESPERYHELYDNYAQTMASRGSWWRLQGAFLGYGYHYSNNGQGSIFCPSEILEKLYNEKVIYNYSNIFFY